jgi:ABC-type phosphate transport system permease subunit
VFLALFQPLSPIIVQVEGEPPKDIGVIDIIFGSLGITGLMLVGSALLGLLVGLLIIWFHKRQAANEPTHAPSSAYGFTPSSAGPERGEGTDR